MPAIRPGLLPTGIPTRLIHGEGDAIVPLDQPQGYLKAAVAAGDDCQIKVLPIDGHFEVVAPGSAAFAAVLSAVGEIISRATMSYRCGCRHAAAQWPHGCGRPNASPCR